MTLTDKLTTLIAMRCLHDVKWNMDWTNI